MLKPYSELHRMMATAKAIIAAKSDRTAYHKAVLKTLLLVELEATDALDEHKARARASLARWLAL